MKNTNEVQKLIEICACKEELDVIEGMSVTSVENITTDEGREGVSIEFIGSLGEKLTLSIMDGSEIHRSAKLTPIYTAQDMRDFEGYTIYEVISDEFDLNCKVVLQSADGNLVTLDFDKALTLDSIFIEE